eukprot:TRINITY_DN25315_c0_g1_i1.p1 TRINITY_DN25315_c0_g1~~TRINITY_DN25315_c0_g1_i1.p1  ORF type:complete len:385 (+),score=78.94 TRINITY_DN25315_c0_g1_i1:145-1299(+)
MASSMEQRVRMLLTTGTVVAASAAAYVVLRQLKAWRSREKRSQVGRVARLFVYPLKSAAGIEVQECRVDINGFPRDREWMIVHFPKGEEEGQMVTIRECPKLACVQPSFNGGGNEALGEFDGDLVLTVPDTKESIVVREPPNAAIVKAQLWRHHTDGVDQGDEVSAFLTAYLRRNGYKGTTPVRLLRAPMAKRVMVEDPKYTEIVADWPNQQSMVTKWADWSPFTLTSVQTLSWVEKEMHNQMKMMPQRFRVNIVVDTMAEGLDADVKGSNVEPLSDRPFQEDAWNEFSVGSVSCKFCKKTGRCTVTTVDPCTGERDAKMEPLRSLKKLHGSNYPHITKGHSFYVEGFREGFLATNILHRYEPEHKIRVGDVINVQKFEDLYRQ